MTKPIDVLATKKNGLEVILLPVDWTDQDRAKYFPSKYDSFSSQSSDFFKATYPIPKAISRS